MLNGGVLREQFPGRTWIAVPYHALIVAGIKFEISAELRQQSRRGRERLSRFFRGTVRADAAI